MRIIASVFSVAIAALGGVYLAHAQTTQRATFSPPELPNPNNTSHVMRIWGPHYIYSDPQAQAQLHADQFCVEVGFDRAASYVHSTQVNDCGVDETTYLAYDRQQARWLPVTSGSVEEICYELLSEVTCERDVECQVGEPLVDLNDNSPGEAPKSTKPECGQVNGGYCDPNEQEPFLCRVGGYEPRTCACVCTGSHYRWSCE